MSEACGSGAFIDVVVYCQTALNNDLANLTVISSVSILKSIYCFFFESDIPRYR